MKLTIEQALKQGVTLHKEGMLQDAERLYRTILQSQPKHPDESRNRFCSDQTVLGGTPSIPAPVQPAVASTGQG